MSAFLTPDTLVLLITESLLLLLLLVLLPSLWGLARRFDIRQTTPEQYRLEKRADLAATIIRFVLWVKIALFIYFIYALDHLSNVITGAMCAAGVINAWSYGALLLGWKLGGLYLFGFWLVLNRLDLERERLPFSRMKFRFALVLVLFVLIEFVLLLGYLDALDPATIVSCCGTLFSSTNTSTLGTLLKLPLPWLLGLFYGLYGGIVLLGMLRRPWGMGLATLVFIPVALLAVISFFSTYVYELPTHTCPFCLLQKEYGYMGYWLYALLFIGTFRLLSGSLESLLTRQSEGFRISVLFLSAFVIMTTYYPVSYYLTNGVFL